ncbi:LOW QUALITY PROTEIN: hypothetical protein ACHAW6_000751 [Cyclotella cf. meneghiniana]
MDSHSYGNTFLSKILERHAKEKKDKYKTACLNRRRDFTPLVYCWHDLQGCTNGLATHCLAACKEVEPHILGHDKLLLHNDEFCHCPLHHPPASG